MGPILSFLKPNHKQPALPPGATSIDKPPRYDRFCAAARKYNPLILNEVRHAFQDNIAQMMSVEAHCDEYRGTQNVRFASLIAASAMSFMLFFESERAPFPENVPMMKRLILAFCVFAFVGLFYVLGYLEARNFCVLVLPASPSSLKNSSSSSSTKNHDAKVKEAQIAEKQRQESKIYLLEQFMMVGDESDVEGKLMMNAIRSKFVDENGSEVAPLDDDDDEAAAAEEEEENNTTDEEKNEKEDGDDDGAEEEETSPTTPAEPTKTEDDEDDDDEDEDETNLDKILIPQKTTWQVSVIEPKILERLFFSDRKKLSPDSSITATKQSQQQKKKGSNTTINTKNEVPEDVVASSPEFYLPQNLGVQFYSDIIPVEAQVVVEADLVSFRGALLSPTVLKVCKATFSLQEFFSKEGIFYPPALRIEMRKMLKKLLVMDDVVIVNDEKNKDE